MPGCSGLCSGLFRAMYRHVPVHAGPCTGMYRKMPVAHFSAIYCYLLLLIAIYRYLAVLARVLAAASPRALGDARRYLVTII